MRPECDWIEMFVCADEPSLVSYIFIWYVWLLESDFLFCVTALYTNMLKIWQTLFYFKHPCFG